MMTRRNLVVSISATLSASLLLTVSCPAANTPATDLAHLDSKAQTSDPEALLQLGRACIEGKGVPRDEAKAAEYFRQAAELGSWKAQHNLGLMYSRGTGVPKDPTQALKWLRQAAGQGALTAQVHLASMLQQGSDLPKDLKEAVSWYEKAAAQGSIPAENGLGGLYYFGGPDLPQDYATSAKWFQLAADQGDAMAQYMVGGMHEHGWGTEKDIHQAEEWYRKSAEQGYAKGQSNLGRLLGHHYEGMNLNRMEAYKWMSLAAEQGEFFGNDSLPAAEHVLSPTELAEARRQIAEFKARQKPAVPPGHK